MSAVTPIQTSREDHIANRARRLVQTERAYAEHLKSFPPDWFDYGEIDPLSRDDALVMACGSCGVKPEVKTDGERYQVVCSCGSWAEPARVVWQAKMNWNTSPYASSPDWRELPFFWLSDLDPEQARERLKILRDHLQLRADLMGLRRVSVQERVGGRFLQRLKAYRAWAMFGLVLMKQQEGRSEPAA